MNKVQGARCNGQGEATSDITYVTRVRESVARLRSSGSIGTNYIEASDDPGKMDEKRKIKIARRESKETIRWLDLILTYDDEDLEKARLELIDEAGQIKKIRSTILKKLGQQQQVLCLDPWTLNYGRR